MSKGKLIVIEGACDGIGKSTQFELLKERLTNEEKEIYNHHFPSYDTIQGRLVEEYLKGNLGKKEELSPYFIHMLYAADRAITWEKELKEQYENGKIILLDRYTTSSLIYQAVLIEDTQKRKDFINYVVDYEYNKLGIKKPDKTIFLSADFDVVTNLRKQRKDNDGIENDIHEKDIEFMKKVYDNAIFCAYYLGWDIINCSDKEKMFSKEEIHEEVYKLVRKR